MDQVDQTTDSPPPQPPPDDDNQVTLKEEAQEGDVVEPPLLQKPLDYLDSCNVNPEFAVICSFIAHFGEKLDLELNIEKLRTAIEDQEYLEESLIDLHVKLLKKIRRYFIRDQWQKALVRFVSEYSYDDANELQAFGYLKTRPSVKLELLRRLLDAQFEHDAKFKATVNSCEAEELRLLPLGRDIKGNTYWQRTDKEGNFRVFQEEPLDYKSWRTVCSNVEELDALIEGLNNIKDDRVKGEPFVEPYNPYPEIFSELFTKEEEQEEEKAQQDELQSSKSRATRGKKGRCGRGKGKKSSPLSILKESDQEYTGVDNKTIESSNICNIDSNTLQQIQSDNHISKSSRSTTNPSNSTLESQVRATIDSLISKVVSSFDYFIRPLSRNSDEKATKEAKNDLPTKNQPRKRQNRKKEQPAEVLPRRSSSRIQQLQQKKIAEQEDELKKMIESSTNERKDGNSIELNFDKNKDRSESPEQGRKRGRRKRKGEATWRRGKGKKKLSWDRDDSDLSSTSSLTESNNDEDDLDDEPLHFDSNNYDDEFACEEEDTNVEPVIIKRARTARQSQNEDGCNESTIIEEDKPCGRCDKSNDPEWILLCDKCDDGYHTACCSPPLMLVPDGDWFCPACEHKMLLEKLIELCNSLKTILEAKERERQKRQRLRQTKASKETSQKQLNSKRARDVLGELNEPLALQALDEELSDNESASSRRPTSRYRNKNRNNKSRAKRRSRAESEDEDEFRVRRPRKTYRRSGRSTSDFDESESTGEESQSSDSDDEQRPKTRRARASVSYRFQEYDELIKSAIQGDTYEEDAVEEDQESESEQCNYGRGKDMATIEAIAYQQENGLVELSTELANDEQDKSQARRTQQRKKKSRRLNDLDADSESGGETSDESFQASSVTEMDDDDEEEDLTEVDSDEDDDTTLDEVIVRTSSRKKGRRKGGKRKKRRDDYESDESDYVLPRTTRRAATRKQVNYKESTDEDEEFLDTLEKRKKVVLDSDAETEASWGGFNTKDLENEDGSTSIETPNSIAEQEQEEDEDISFKKETVKKTYETKPPVPDKSSSNQLNESIDELVMVKYKAPSPTSPQQSPADPILAKKQLGTEVTTHRLKTDKNLARDPIQELNQYCMDTAQNQTTMFSSYNETLSNNKNISSSPPHPKFYDDDDSITSTPEARTKKSKKVKLTPSSGSKNSIPSRIVDPPSRTTDIDSRGQTSTDKPTNAPVASMTSDIPKPKQSHNNMSSMIQGNNLVNSTLLSSPQRFISSPVPAPMYPMPMQQSPARQPMPAYSQHMSKLPHPHPTSLAATQPQHIRPQPYPSPYGAPMTQYMGQPRHNIPLGAYPNPHAAGSNLWSHGGVMSSDQPPPMRQPLPAMYYSEAGLPPNPNFSIQQLLSNPYAPPGFSSPIPNMQPINSPRGGRHPSPNLRMPPVVPPNPASSTSQPLLPEDSSLASDNRNNDKDMIRGMSDVISFIGDT